MRQTSISDFSFPRWRMATFLRSSTPPLPTPPLPRPPLPSLRFELMFHNPPTRNENQPSFQNSAGFCEILFSLPPTVKILFLSKSSFNTFIFQRPFSTFSPSGFSNTCVCFFFQQLIFWSVDNALKMTTFAKRIERIELKTLLKKWKEGTSEREKKRERDSERWKKYNKRWKRKLFEGPKRSDWWRQLQLSEDQSMVKRMKRMEIHQRNESGNQNRQPSTSHSLTHFFLLLPPPLFLSFFLS